MNNKGFMFIETIVMVVILSVGLLVLYSSYNNSIAFEKTRLSYDDTPYIYRTFYITKFLQENTDINSSLDELLEEKAIRIIGTETSELFDDTETENKFKGIKSKFHFYKILLVSSDIRNNDNNQFIDLDISNKFKKYINSLDYNNESGDKKYYIIVEFAEKLGSSNEDNSDGILECNPNDQESDCKVSYASIEIKKGAIVTPDDIDEETSSTEKISCEVISSTNNTITVNFINNDLDINTWHYSIDGGVTLNETAFSTITIDNLTMDTEYTVTVYGDDNTSDIGNCMGKTLIYESFNNYDYQPSAYTEPIEVSGYYKLQVWGAQGGRTYEPNITDLGDQYHSALGGKGGYSEGVIYLNNGDILYINVGGQGLSGTKDSGIKQGGTNGGGASGYYHAGSGGGGTDIRIKPYTAASGTSYDTYYARVIVAGGGGGAANCSDVHGGYGGGKYGGSGQKIGYSQVSGPNYGGSSNDFEYPGNPGLFGVGGSAFAKESTISRSGGGGGGWYGGAGGGWNPYGGNESQGYCVGGTSGGGGGSGFIYTESNASYVPSGWLLNNNYYLLSEYSATYDGSKQFLSPGGILKYGHSGNGYARIIYCGDNASDCNE